MAVILSHSLRETQEKKTDENVRFVNELNCDLKAEDQRTKENCQFQEKIKKRRLKNSQETFKRKMNNEFVILVLSTDGNESDLKRYIRDLQKISSGIPIVVSLPDNNPDLQEKLSFPSIHIISRVPTSSFPIPFASYAQKAFAALENLPGGGFFGWEKRRNICFIPNTKNSISLMQTTQNKTEIVSYEFTAEDTKAQRQVSLGESVFNPNMQKILSLNDSKYKSSLSAEEDPLEKLQTSSFYRRRCREANRLRDNLIYLQQEFSSFQHVIIADPKKHFSPSLVSFFLNTSNVFDIDPSIYCVSAHNLLQRKGSNPPIKELNRVDHFVYGGATLLPRKIVNEIVDRFQIPLHSTNKDSPDLQDHTSMDDLTDWLSWTAHRKLRGCIIPARSRVCSHPSACSVPMETVFDLNRLLRYTYFTEEFIETQKLTPLKYTHLPCKNNMKPPLRTDVKSESFGIYVKMISIDDNLNVYTVFKCFGMNPTNYMGGFEALHQFYWSNHTVYIIGVPYSRFSPSIVRGSTIYTADLGPMDMNLLSTVDKWKDFQGRSFNITTVPYSFNDEKSAGEEKETSH